MNKWFSILVGVFSLAIIHSAQATSLPLPKAQDSMIQKEIRYDQETTTHTPLDQDQIRAYKRSNDFNYVEELPKENWWTKFKRWDYDLIDRIIKWIFGTAPASGFWATVVEALPYLLVLGLLFLIGWIFSKTDSGRLLFEKTATPQVGLAEDEELIQRDDIQKLIDDALAAGNYRLAVRFYYLLILQKLSGAALIKWQVQKTNHDYIFEIEDQQLRQQFRNITDIYDYIWYGNFEVDATAFAKAEHTFLALKRQL